MPCPPEISLSTIKTPQTIKYFIVCLPAKALNNQIHTQNSQKRIYQNVACEHRHKRHSENYDKQFGSEIKFHVHSLFNRATLSEVLHNQFVANHTAEDGQNSSDSQAQKDVLRIGVILGLDLNLLFTDTSG